MHQATDALSKLYNAAVHNTELAIEIPVVVAARRENQDNMKTSVSSSRTLKKKLLPSNVDAYDLGSPTFSKFIMKQRNNAICTQSQELIGSPNSTSNLEKNRTFVRKGPSEVSIQNLVRTSRKA